jgi:hypothetical protein
VATATPERPPLNAYTTLGTFFFYWYNCPRAACDAGELTAVPPGWTTPLPGDPDPRDGTSYSSLNEDWYEQELRDMRSAGMQIVFPVSWGDHPHDWFRQDTLRLLVQANGVQPRPLQIGMFLDTTAQQGMYNKDQGGGYRYGPGALLLPLTDPHSGYYFYDRHIKGFFQQIPRKMWASEQGRPIIVVYGAACCQDLQRSAALWSAVKHAFARDFGVEPWLILEDTWFSPEARATPPGMRTIDEVADGRYRWGAALFGPQTDELRGYTVSTAGPGFDNRKLPENPDPRFRPRAETVDGRPGDAGAFFRSSLDAVPPTTNLLLIETWNEWPESTGIARATYPDISGGRLPEDYYIDILRRWRFGS